MFVCLFAFFGCCLFQCTVIVVIEVVVSIMTLGVVYRRDILE